MEMYLRKLGVWFLVDGSEAWPVEALFPPSPFPLGLRSDSGGLQWTQWTQPFRQLCHSNFMDWTGLDWTGSPVQLE